jgi:hypothetical protein
MSVSAIDSRYQFNVLVWYAVGALALLFAAMLLAANQLLVALLLVGVFSLFTLPYHAQLSAIVATATFSSAFILPMVPGRPYVWETAALFGWTGVLLLTFLRRYPPDLMSTLRRNRWIFVGILVYCLTLLLIMQTRGFGLRVLGSGGGMMGGRLYLQQLICAIFPLLFCMIQMSEKMLVRLLMIQWLLSTTYFVSDFAFSFGGVTDVLLAFFELPGDAANFEGQFLHFGIRRFQSFQNAGLGLVFLLLARYRLSDFFSGRRWWLLPVFVGIFGMSLLSGHRTIVFYITGTVAVIAVAQRFFTARTLILAPLAGAVLLLVLYSQADRLPLSAQRAVSFLPGIQINAQAANDAAKTIHGRRMLRLVGAQMMPDYLWVGRGFAKYADIHLTVLDPDGVTPHVEQGVFYNGFIGLMVNTGLSGTVGMMLVILGGTALAWRVLKMVRRTQSEDTLIRAAAVLAGFWFTSVLFFLFFHGDAELALKSFALQLGTLIMAERLLIQRLTRPETALAMGPETPAPAGSAP